VKALNTEKNTLKEMLHFKLAEMRDSLFGELQKIEDEIKSHMTLQKNENTKLYQTITDLKLEKTELQKNLQTLNQRYTDLEMTVGEDK
jgi:anion-transporting  ArsA/GET3 family ATPase